MSKGDIHDPRRRVPLTGAVNFRDLGGYRAGDRRMRWNVLYRADSLADLTPEDLVAVARLGFSRIIDFRLPAERAERPDRLPEGAAIREIQLGFIPAGTLDMLQMVKSGAVSSDDIKLHVAGHYRRFPVDHNDVYGRFLREVINARGEPVLFHCTSGKDRTGFAAAVALMAAGVSREDILDDYEMTNQYRRDVSHFFSPATPADVPHTLTSAFRAYMAESLATIDRVHGSTDAYLEKGLGLTPEERADFVALVTEPSGR